MREKRRIPTAWYRIKTEDNARLPRATITRVQRYRGTETERACQYCQYIKADTVPTTTSLAPTDVFLSGEMLSFENRSTAVWYYDT